MVDIMAEDINLNREHIIALSVVFLALFSLVYLEYSGVFKESDVKEDLKDSAISSMANIELDTPGVKLSDMYYLYETAELLGMDFNDSVKENMHKYISLYYIDGLYSDTKKGMDDPIKATFMVSKLDSEMKQDVWDQIRFRELYIKKPIISESKHDTKRAFYFYKNLILPTEGYKGDTENLVNSTTFYEDYKGTIYRYHVSYCNYTPPRGDNFLERMYYHSLLLKAFGKRQISTEVADISDVEIRVGGRDTMKNASLVFEDSEDIVKKRCISDSYKEKLRNTVESMNYEEYEDSFIDLFYLYRLRKFYGLPAEHIRSKIISDFYQGPEKGFASGEDQNTRRNFYGACALIDCNESTL